MNIDLRTPCRVHFIGIGGISMSGFAELLVKNGFKVSGSDSNQSEITDRLEELGIRVNIGQRAANITDDVEVVVYTGAVKEDNEELMAARASKATVLERSAFIGELMKVFGDSLCISGSHGKTTTTSMMSVIELECGLNPTVSVGGILDAIGGNMRIGGSDNFILESCEYLNSFLKFNPTRAIILNIEAEHLDFFKDLDDIRESFKIFAKKIPADGALVINGEIEAYEELTKDLACRVYTYGICDSEEAGFAAGSITASPEESHAVGSSEADSEAFPADDSDSRNAALISDDSDCRNAALISDGTAASNTEALSSAGTASEAFPYDFTAASLNMRGDGFYSYDLYINGKKEAAVDLNVRGRHNVSNSLAAIAMSLDMGLELENILRGLRAFTGTRRRLELKGEVCGVKVYDDYAHHPSEIRATLAAANAMEHRELWVCFQPHTYSRTKFFLEDFARELSACDHVVLADIYAAREKDPGDISSKDIAKLLSDKYGKDVHHFSSFEEIENFLLQHCSGGDLLITMGAGNVVKVGETIVGA